MATKVMSSMSNQIETVEYTGRREILSRLRKPGRVYVYVSGYSDGLYIQVSKASLIREIGYCGDEFSMEFCLQEWGETDTLINRAWQRPDSVRS